MTFVHKIPFARKHCVMIAVYIDLALDYIVEKLNAEQLNSNYMMVALLSSDSPPKYS